MVKVYCDGKLLSHDDVIPTCKNIESSFEGQGGIHNVEGSRTTDNIRFSESSLPLKLRWTDNAEHTWEVWIEGSHDDRVTEEVTIAFPCTMNVVWHGGDVVTRTAFDSNVQIVEARFVHQKPSWMHQQNGIWVEVNGYRYGSESEDLGDIDKWNDTVEKAKNGVKLSVG